ncbi:CoA-disulfide reductase [Streptomyces calidiresistens]|uniref:CoA-disulfide reductase n=1 Tax=Streptomyces calidiresistens TaxID=1485586 RepID=A0A7W3T5K0_9ACTN|nr:FAD-dependent oxidoreductase [Streptomyces calidiresistens]MBB0231355.1 CoA-disulfide reductase [Streptomyces calidiresistens]
MKTIVVGGVAGGMSTAARLRRLDESAEIVVLERGPHVSYANCGLPYRVGGVIAEREALLPHSPASLSARLALDIRVRHEALAVDREARTLLVRDLTTGEEYEEGWDRLVLAPGARPVVPDVPGVERALTLRDVTDTDRVLERLGTGARTAVVIGGGFIGVETAENLRLRGLGVTLVELADRILPHLDPEMAVAPAAELARHGVVIRTGTKVVRVPPDAVETSDGERLPADLVLLAVGVRPEIDLARAAGLVIGPRGGIAVDERMRTSDPRILAVGDAAEKRDALSGEPVLIPLANLANRHGRLAADAILDRPVAARPCAGTSILRVLDLTVAACGWSETRLRAAGRPHRVIHTHPASHAGYYPGAEPMSLKLLVEPGSERILGAQAVGGEGVDKRIDVLATAMAAGLPAPRLADIELAYAPPYGAARDPITMLGHIAENLADGTARTVQWHEVDAAREAGATLVDVRTPAEYAAGALPGAVNIPVDELRERLGEVPPDSRVIVYCRVGARGHVAARILAGHGRDVRNLDGGLLTRRAGEAAGGGRRP